MSAQAKHTPGPWRVSHRNPLLILPLALRKAIIRCDLPKAVTAELARQEAEANATLIAAAPELLAELRKARDRLASAMRIGGSSPEYIAEAVASHDAAIAKATGAQP